MTDPIVTTIVTSSLIALGKCIADIFPLTIPEAGTAEALKPVVGIATDGLQAVASSMRDGVVRTQVFAWVGTQGARFASLLQHLVVAEGQDASLALARVREPLVALNAAAATAIQIGRAVGRNEGEIRLITGSVFLGMRRGMQLALGLVKATNHPLASVTLLIGAGILTAIWLSRSDDTPQINFWQPAQA